MARAAESGILDERSEWPERPRAEFSVNGWDVLEQAAELARRGEEFALATVVWRQGPSSSQQGSRAIVTGAGEVHGWIGGACAEPAVIREAQRAIADGEPRLLLLGTPEQFGVVPAGMTVIPISCQSEGAMEVYIEPVVSSPHLVVVGRSPMAHTLHELAQAVGWRSDLVDVGDFAADARRRPRCGRRRHAGPRRRGGDRGGGAGRARLPRVGGVAPARRRRARLPGGPRSAGRRAGPGPGAGGTRPRPHLPPRDRRRHPGRARPAAGGRRARPAPRRSAGAAGRRSSTRCAG